MCLHDTDYILHIYLRQVNEVNGGDTMSVCVLVFSQRTGQSNRFKIVEATDFKLDMT